MCKLSDRREGANPGLRLNITAEQDTRLGEICGRFPKTGSQNYFGSNHVAAKLCSGPCVLVDRWVYQDPDKLKCVTLHALLVEWGFWKLLPIMRSSKSRMYTHNGWCYVVT